MRVPLAAVALALALPMAAQAQTSNCVDASTLEEKHRRGGIVGGAQKVMSMPSTAVNAPPDERLPVNRATEADCLGKAQLLAGEPAGGRR
jgi:hypothetical protein